MEELLRTNDITLIPLARAVLDDEGIETFELDVNMSILEGSIGILPRRLMVRTGDLARARRVLWENGVRLDG
ncbi:putative signal transducing protein [Roseivivax sp. CAU 1753]